MFSKIEKKIFVLFLGEAHYDPVTEFIARDLLIKFHKQEIPVVYCKEQSSKNKVNLDIRIKNLKEHIEEFEKFFNFFSQFFENKKKLNRPYIALNEEQALKEKIATIIQTSPEDKACVSFYLGIIYLNTFKEKLKTLEYIKLNNLPYFPIDFHHEDRVSYFMDVSKDVSNLCLEEQSRTNLMIENIWVKALPKLQNTGGVILCNIGATHAQRLATKLYIKAKSHNLLHSDNITIESKAIYCYSDYLMEGQLETLEHTLTITKDSDTNEIQKCNSSFPLIPLFFEEDKFTGNFSNEELHNIYSDIVNFFKIPLLQKLEMKQSTNIAQHNFSIWKDEAKKNLSKSHEEITLQF
ncbi:MAG: hypothetical protein H0T84_10905 [Tatlockia sp.]|nr:hypothetical protein [Tatlockia sp.]